ncbi:ABC transporter permease subunit [Candidatus Bipolaricaulota bacterium]|nr:ABC transporter permease subunit [Candidatus Bipolaricaulota bacterium]
MPPESLELHIDYLISQFVDWLTVNYAGVFEQISDIIITLLLSVRHVFLIIPWWLLIAIIGIVGWLLTRRVTTTVTLVTLSFVIVFFGMWRPAIDTLSLVLTSVIIAIGLGIPVGVLMAEFDVINTVVTPILDMMQTLPGFVYLIPAIMLFGLGKVPATIATLIYSTPPVVRFTNIGLRQVSSEIMESATAFGTTRFQLLKEIRLPLAATSILGGINQTIMMALAMTVIASMIGAGGLGKHVLVAINRLKVGAGFEAGFSIVCLAIVIDRLSSGIAEHWRPPES